MLISQKPRVDLTYCLNVHPGERWADQQKAIEECSLKVRDAVAPGKPFGLGLRVANLAAEELGNPELREEVRDFFARHNVYAFSINGFPYSAFHGSAVKEKVYLPDWQSARRRDYTMRLADLLVEWLPEGMTGSISTVPGSYKPWINKAQEVATMARHLVETAFYLHELRERTGREIHLGLEPEPDCFLETTEETIAFFKESLLPGGISLFREKGIKEDRAEEILRRHLGVCFDTCHLALQFEDLVDSWKRLEAEGIRISKVQLSSALEVPARPEEWAKLEAFIEPVYLHQVKARRTDGSVIGWPDLPAAMMTLRKKENLETLRVHFHVPLFSEGIVGTTSHCLTPEFFRLLREGNCPHLEIETYTFNVFPESLRSRSLDESVAEEYRWALGNLGL